MQTIDATDQVVAPGFIDIHSHTLTPLGQQHNVLDGVTTQLEMEAGALPSEAAGDLVKDRPIINYGASVGHFAARIQVLEGRDLPYFFYRGEQASMASPAFTQLATASQIAAIRDKIEDGLDGGGLGIGLLLDYMRDAVSQEELAMIFRVAGERKVPVFVHVRRNLPGDSSGLDEVLALAEQYDTAVFICHITHNAMNGIEAWLEKIDAARARGVRVATETLSYLAGGTSISADVFRKRDWRSIFAIDYSDVQWVATGEWLTQESWEHYAETEPGGMVNHHYVKEAWLHSALRWSDMMVSTDALPAFTPSQMTNPNISGSFSRLLGRYVRDQGVLGLSDALSRISLKQAQWLETFAPQFRRKGRVQVGADADLVVFDPKKVAAGADYGSPWQPPSGIDWVIIGGVVTVENGGLVSGAAAGRYLDTSPLAH
jgi:N-acyl-D-aspartate/D-glutamate deacylase